MDGAPNNRNLDLGAVINFVLMVFWGQAPSPRRAPRVIVERRAYAGAASTAPADPGDWSEARIRGA
jgi:hypothetical protein